MAGRFCVERYNDSGCDHLLTRYELPHVRVSGCERLAQFRQTRVLVSKIIRLTIETGSVTGIEQSIHMRLLADRFLLALCTLITLALFYGIPNRVYYTTLGLIIPALYANSILAVLNSRLQIVGGRGTSLTSTDIRINSSLFICAALPDNRSVIGAQKTEELRERESPCLGKMLINLASRSSRIKFEIPVLGGLRNLNKIRFNAHLTHTPSMPCDSIDPHIYRKLSTCSYQSLIGWTRAFREELWLRWRAPPRFSTIVKIYHDVPCGYDFDDATIADVARASPQVAELAFTSRTDY
ncbi:hypothetical protein DFH06DRAFT_1297123 [Mycena polygramma]|nr:hypothetical protein DFH06DRAFT_1297123 [Mycena polygramma]